MKIGSEVTLTDMDLRICRLVADAREDCGDRAYGGTNTSRVVVRPGSNANHMEGFAGELAFCRLFNLCPDLEIRARSAKLGEDFGDCVLHDGRLVDVKTTMLPENKLILPHWTKPTVDLYALMTGPLPTLTFRGFIAAGELAHESRITDLGHGATFVAKQQELYEVC